MSLVWSRSSWMICEKFCTHLWSKLLFRAMRGSSYKGSPRNRILQSVPKTDKLTLTCLRSICKDMLCALCGLPDGRTAGDTRSTRRLYDEDVFVWKILLYNLKTLPIVWRGFDEGQPSRRSLKSLGGLYMEKPRLIYRLDIDLVGITL